MTDPRPTIGEIICWLVRAGCAWQIGKQQMCNASLKEARDLLSALQDHRRTQRDIAKKKAG